MKLLQVSKKVLDFSITSGDATPRRWNFYLWKLFLPRLKTGLQRADRIACSLVEVQQSYLRKMNSEITVQGNFPKLNRNGLICKQSCNLLGNDSMENARVRLNRNGHMDRPILPQLNRNGPDTIEKRTRQLERRHHHHHGDCQHGRWSIVSSSSWLLLEWLCIFWSLLWD